MTEPLPVKLFLSWAHADRRYKEDLVRRLTPQLAMLRDVRIEWREDSLLPIGDHFPSAIKDEIDRCHYGVLLLSPHYVTSRYILPYELPRFVGPMADRGALPVALRPVPLDGSCELHGIEELMIFQPAEKAFSQLGMAAKRDDFAGELAAKIRLRVLRDRQG